MSHNLLYVKNIELGEVHTMLHNSDLLDHVFSTPYENDFDTVQILSGYASPEFLVFILNKFPNLSIDLTIGMIPKDKIFKSNHFAFVNLMSRYPKLTVSYVTSSQPSHSKIYHWLHSQTNETKTFVGSANFSINGFLINQETMLQSNELTNQDLSTNLLTTLCTSEEAARFVKDDLPLESEISNEKENIALAIESKKADLIYSEADLHILRDYSKIVHIDRIHSNTSHVQNLPRGEGFSSVNVSLNSTSRSLKHQNIPPLFPSKNQATLTLLTRSGEVGAKSGLNWGQRAHRNLNEAYIPVSSKIHKDQPDFFPELAELFTIKTDDGEEFTCVMSQNNRKCIETTESNALLGRYFRKKLGLPEGTFITLDHLKNYGKTYVTITKLDDRSYLMSF